MSLPKQATRPANDTKLIPLTRGFFTLVDAKDYKYLSQYNWYIDQKSPRHLYAARNLWVGRKNRHISMHRALLGLKFGDKRKADHIDGNGLNNTRQNLRIATHSQNLCNRPAPKGNTSGYKGVYFHKNWKWVAGIKINYKKIYLGGFTTKKEAYKAYCDAAKKLHGEFANIT